MLDRMMGLETEMGFSVPGLGLDRRIAALDRIMNLARKRHAHMNGLHGSGMFLGNGSRFYIDTGGHPEICTPEVDTPWELARYIAADDEILYRLSAEAIAVERLGDVLFYKCHVDYTDLATWGCHENFGHKASKSALPAQIIPHLASRICFSGAGGMNPHSQGIEFCLSPRVWHLDGPSSNNSTGSRAIYHYKDESLSGHGWSRLHVICGESVMSHRAMCLKAGSTALVVALVEGGLRPGDKVQLASALDAMRRFNADPTGRATAPLARGGEATALQIQRHYLEFAEAHLGHHSMPAWAPALCRLWRETLDMLERGPEAADLTLDWAIKHSLYNERARRRGLTPEQLACWNEALAGMKAVWDDGEGILKPFTAALLLASDGPFREKARKQAPRLRERGLSWDDVENVLQLRAELCELETRFSQLGPKGIFNALDAAGHLRHALPEITPAGIEAAITEPPARGRAGVRGRLIMQFRGQARYAADWSCICDSTGRRIDLSDPHVNGAPDWTPSPNEWIASVNLFDRELSALECHSRRGEFDLAHEQAGVIAPMLPPSHHTADRLRLITAEVQARRGFHAEAVAALDQFCARHGTDLVLANIYVTVHRFNGLVPRPGPLEAWLRKVDEFCASERNDGIVTSLRPGFQGHRGALLLHTGRLDEARAVLEECSGFRTMVNPHSFVSARNLCDLAEVYRRLGDPAAAHRALDFAQQTQTRLHLEGDYAELNLPRRAKLAADRRAAKSLLSQARLIQRRLRHRAGMAKTMLLQARLFPSIWHNQRRKRILLDWQRTLPTLRDCPLMARIMANWDQWVSGHTPAGEDFYWGL